MIQHDFNSFGTLSTKKLFKLFSDLARFQALRMKLQDSFLVLVLAFGIFACASYFRFVGQKHGVFAPIWSQCDVLPRTGKNSQVTPDGNQICCSLQEMAVEMSETTCNS